MEFNEFTYPIYVKDRKNEDFSSALLKCKGKL